MLYGSDEFGNERSKNFVDFEEKLLCFWLEEVPWEYNGLSELKFTLDLRKLWALGCNNLHHPGESLYSLIKWLKHIYFGVKNWLFLTF